MSDSGGRGGTVFDFYPRFAQAAVVGRPSGQGQGKRQHGRDADDQCGTSMCLHVARYSFLCESFLIQCGSYLERRQTRIDAYGCAGMLLGCHLFEGACQFVLGVGARIGTFEAFGLLTAGGIKSAKGVDAGVQW